MTTDLVTVNANASIDELEGIFKANNFHHVPVLNKEGKLVGIVSREDYYKFHKTLFRNPSIIWMKDEAKGLTVEDMMTSSPLVLDPDDSIGLAGDIFLSNQMHALPIVDDGDLVGILTVHDLLAYSFGEPKVENLNLSYSVSK